MVKRDRSGEAVTDRVTKAIMGALRDGEMPLVSLVDQVASRLNVERHVVVRSVYRLREEGVIELIDPSPPSNPLKFLFSSRATWFWLLAAVVGLTDLSIYVLPQSPPFVYLRYILGSLFVLYIPGASLIELLYPRRGDLSQLERLALSIGLSLALVPLVGLVLNYTPWGIRLNPVVASLTTLTVVLALGAVMRKYSYHVLAYREVEGAG